MSVDDICAVTKVSPRYVEALEAGEYAALPGGVFRKGILRSYLGAVGLEEHEWVARFESSLRATGTAVEDSVDWTEFAENVRKARVKAGSPTGWRWVGVFAMVLMLVVFGWFVWTFVLHNRVALLRGPVVGQNLQVRPMGLSVDNRLRT